MTPVPPLPESSFRSSGLICTDPWLALAVGVSAVLQLAVLYTPLDRDVGTVPLDPPDWGIIGAVLPVGLPAYPAAVLTIKRHLPFNEDSGEDSR